MGNPRKKRGHAATTVTMVVGAALLACGLAMMLTDASTERKYSELATEVRDTDAPSSDDSAAGTGIDWDSLLATNGDVVGWLAVAGTSVDYPVVQSSESDPDFYLSHDLWGSSSSAGAPYLDVRSDPEGLQLTIYGHHMLYAGSMFADLAPTFAQGSFDGLGTATWTTEASGVTTFRPLCASKVDKSDQAWQQFDFTDTEELREWLAEAVGTASAVSDDADALVGGAERVLVLVTCSGRATYGARARTVTVFVSTE